MRRAAAAVSGADKESVRRLPMQRLRMEVLEGFEGMAKLPDGMKEEGLFQVTRCCIN